MNPQQSPARPPAARPAVATAADARRLVDEMMDVMGRLREVLEEETALVRVGKVREAMQLGSQKNELSARFVTVVEILRAAQAHLARVAPDLLASVHRHYETFRAMLQVNLTVLATAHAVSESIIRGVNSELQRKHMPSGYTAAGVRAAPGRQSAAPIAVSRSL